MPTSKTRWVIRSIVETDVRQAVKLLRRYYPEDNWTTADFRKYADASHHVARVIHTTTPDNRSVVIAVLLYRTHSHGSNKRLAYLSRIAVHGKWRRRGIAKALLDYATERSGADVVAAIVRETNLPAHLFLRSQGFICDKVLKEHYVESSCDGYRFHRRPKFNNKESS